MAHRKSLIAAAFAPILALSAAPLAAQNEGFQSEAASPQLVTQFDAATVSRLLLDVRATWETEPSIDGHTNYRASAEGGLNFTLSPRACSERIGCLGLMMLAVYTDVRAPNMAALDGFLNQLNDTSPSVKVFRNTQGTVVLQSYINSAGGITYRNAQSELLVFGQDIVSVSQAIARFEQQQ